ncbi:MAG: extracellular solute-binding protein [Rhodospirillales bacterium]
MTGRKRFALAVLVLAAGGMPVGMTAAAPPAAAPAAVLDGPAPVHAIAMHGPPKYPPGFEYFDYVDPRAPKGGTLRLSRVGSFDSLNPFIIKGTPAEGWRLSHERLLERSQDEPFTLYARIAESLTVAPDRSWIAFTIRARARFHDGSPITADDVLFSWQTLKEQGRPNHRLYYREVAKAEVLGPRKIKFTFKGADNRELPLIVGLMPILSRRAFEGRVFGETALTPFLGSGPYKVAHVEQGRSIVYERVEDYWGRDLPFARGHFNFDRVRYDYFRDSTVELEAFKAGAVDLRVETDPTRWAYGYASPALKRGDIVRRAFENGRPAGMYGFVFNTRRRIFKNPDVRAALAFAFDFPWVNRTLYHGAYKRTASYFENSELAATAPPGPIERELLAPFEKELPPEVFAAPYRPPAGQGDGFSRDNLKRALAMLRGAGWRFRGEGMALPDGRPAAFEILLLHPRNERLALSFARRLAKLGLEVKVRTVDSAQYQYRLNTYDFDMILYWWDQSLSPGNEQAFYFGSAAARKDGTRNYPGIESAAADAMIERITAARDRAHLVGAARALDRVLQWGHYAVPLFHQPRDRVAYWNRFGLPDVTPLYGFQIETWWIDRAKARRIETR